MKLLQFCGQTVGCTKINIWKIVQIYNCSQFHTQSENQNQKETILAPLHLKQVSSGQENNIYPLAVHQNKRILQEFLNKTRDAFKLYRWRHSRSSSRVVFSRTTVWLFENKYVICQAWRWWVRTYFDHFSNYFFFSNPKIKQVLLQTFNHTTVQLKHLKWSWVKVFIFSLKL